MQNLRSLKHTNEEKTWVIIKSLTQNLTDSIHLYYYFEITSGHLVNISRPATQILNKIKGQKTLWCNWQQNHTIISCSVSIQVMGK